MKIIRSRDNPLVRRLQGLAQSARERGKTGQAVLEGIHLVEAWLDSRGLPLALAISESGASHPEIQNILKRFGGLQPTLLSDSLFASCSSVSPAVGIAAIITQPNVPLPDGAREPCLMLERIQDPGNLGTLLRSAAASGIERALLSPGCAAAWSPRVLRAGMGAHFRIAIHEGVPLADAAARFEGRILAATLDGEIPYFQEDLKGSVALVIGNEGAGLSGDLLGKIGRTLRIPMAPGVESLNAAVAGSILMFERLRQLSS
jgi:TrmH family RNA methyltransferase